jgi:PAS domain S-box-containing protein
MREPLNPEPDAGPPAHLLVVDDEPRNRELLAIMLAPAGYVVGAAASGAAALAMVARHPPDLILLDVMMPDMDGYQVAARLKGDPATKHIPIVMVTALDDRESRLRGLNSGAEDFLTKPVDRIELSTRVRNLLRLKACGDCVEKQNHALEAEVRSRTADLRLERDRAERYLDAAEIMLLALDLEGRITLVNRYACSILEWTAEELLGRSWIDSCCPAGTRGAIRTSFAHLAGGENVATVENAILTRSGVTRRIEWRHTLLRDDEGRVTGTLSSGTDVTAHRQRLEEVEALKTGFLSTVSHELRTPLTSIRGSLGLLASEVLGPLSDEGRGVVAIAERNACRLLVLINDILDIERLETGTMEPHCTLVSIDSVLRRAVDSMATLGQHGVTLQAPDISGTMWADPDRIVQVLVNLLSNAVKFSPPGTAVTIAVACDAGGVEFRVTDRGRGVPAALRQAIFERFRQVETSDAREKGGIGLGLAICQSIIEQHHGTIGLDSTEGAGSTFWFRLPPRPALHAGARLRPADARAS